jgi:hypothetical protein
MSTEEDAMCCRETQPSLEEEIRRKAASTNEQPTQAGQDSMEPGDRKAAAKTEPELDRTALYRRGPTAFTA